MAKATPKMEYIPCKGNKSPILQCNGMKKESEYYVSWSPFASDGKVPFCKQCVERIFLYFYESSGNTLQSALYYTCQKLDIPFIFEVYQTINNQKIEADNADKIINGYMGRYIRELTTKYRNMKEIWTDFSATNVDLADIDSRIEGREIKKKEQEAFQLDWGVFEDVEDYVLLEYLFEELTEGKPLTKPQEMLYRDLCLARLAKRKAEQSKQEQSKGEDVQKIQKQILDLMKTLNIDKFAENKELALIDRMLETRIAIQEKEKPAFHYKDIKTNADFSGRGKYYYNHVWRPFKNVMKDSKEYNIVPDDNDVEDSYYEEIMKEFKETEREA